MKKYEAFEKGLTFDDVVLVPQYSEIESRSQVDISSNFLGLTLKFPIISANMDTVTGIDMAMAMYGNGGLGILHRYASPDTIVDWINTLNQLGYPAIPSIGVQAKDVDLAKRYLDAGAYAINIDIAHGGSMAMRKTIKTLPANTRIIAGNVATYDTAYILANCGVDVLKCGIGSGANCSTRVVTGHGVPQLSAIVDVSRVKKAFYGVKIIADGGIRNSGDIVKALAFGADAVMVGSLLAGTLESPGEVVDGYKIYRGMASKEAQMGFLGKVNNSAPEGVTTKVPFKGPVKDILEQLAGGIRSGCSYSGAFDLQQLRENAEYVEISHAGYIEGTPHGLK